MLNMIRCAAPGARARAMQSAFLTLEEWKHLAEMNSTGEVLSWLTRKKIISSDTIGSIEAEKEIRESIILCAEKLIHFSYGKLRQLLAFFIYHFDLLNIEAMIRHIHEVPEAKPVQPDSLYDTGIYGLVDINQLSAATNFAVLEQMLTRTMFSNPLAYALELYTESGDVSAITTELEVAFLENWLRAADECESLLSADPRSGDNVFRAFLGFTVIRSILRILFCRQGDRKAARKFLSILLQDPELRNCMTAIEGMSAEETYYHLASLFFSPKLYKQISEISFDLNNLDFHFRKFLAEIASRQKLRAGIGIEFLLSFNFIKTLEVQNLIYIIESRDLGLNPEQTLNYLAGVA